MSFDEPERTAPQTFQIAPSKSITRNEHRSETARALLSKVSRALNGEQQQEKWIIFCRMFQIKIDPLGSTPPQLIDIIEFVKGCFSVTRRVDSTLCHPDRREGHVSFFISYVFNIVNEFQFLMDSRRMFATFHCARGTRARYTILLWGGFISQVVSVRSGFIRVFLFLSVRRRN